MFVGIKIGNRRFEKYLPEQPEQGDPLPIILSIDTNIEKLAYQWFCPERIHINDFDEASMGPRKDVHQVPSDERLVGIHGFYSVDSKTGKKFVTKVGIMTLQL